MKKQKFKIWLGLLLALFLGSLGSLDQIWCFEATGCCYPQRVPCSPPVAPESPCQCTGCSDSPVVLGGFRLGQFRLQCASLVNQQMADADFVYETRLPQGDYSGDWSSHLPSAGFNPFAFLRTVILII
jgi:hypothetical protein